MNMEVVFIAVSISYFILSIVAYMVSRRWERQFQELKDKNFKLETEYDYVCKVAYGDCYAYGCNRIARSQAVGHAWCDMHRAYAHIYSSTEERKRNAYTPPQATFENQEKGTIGEHVRPPFSGVRTYFNDRIVTLEKKELEKKKDDSSDFLTGMIAGAAVSAIMDSSPSDSSSSSDYSSSDSSSSSYDGGGGDSSGGGSSGEW